MIETLEKLEIFGNSCDMITESIDELLLIVDQENNINYVNNSPLLKILGYQSNDLIGKSWFDFVHPEDLENIINILKIYTPERVSTTHLRLKHKNNDFINFESYIKKIIDHTGHVKIFIILKDISEILELKRKENELRESEEKFRTITEQLLMGIAILQDDRFRYVNKQIADIFGYTPEEMTNWGKLEYAKLIHPDDREMALEQARKKQLGLPGSVIHYQFRGITKKGKVKWLEIYSNSINYRDEIADLITIIDITGEKEAERKLKESEEKYRLLTENLNDIITVVNDKGKAEYINEEAHQKIMGYSYNDIMYKNVFELIHPEDREKAMQEFKKSFKTGEGFIEARIFHKDGYYIWTETNGKAFIDNDGKLKILTITRDITERKKIEEKAKQEKEKAEMYLNLVNVIIVALDRDGNISMINKKGYDILGWNEGELIGKNWFENCLPQYDRNILYDYFKKLMSGELDVVPFYENSVINKNREEKLIAWSTILFKDSDGKITGLLSSGEDITEKKKAENELRESKQLLETTLYNLQDAIFILDNKIPPKVIECNPASERIFGYSRDEIIGNTTAFLHVNDNSLKDFQETVLPKLQQDGNIQNFEFRLKRKNGKIFPTEHAISDLRNENGETLGIVSLVRDITERKKVEQELIRKNMEINTIFNTIPAMLNVVDREYNVINISDAFAKAFHNGKKDNAIGRKCYQAHKQRNNICPHCTVTKVFESGNIETRLSTPEEEALMGKSLKIYSAPIKDINGNISGAVEAIMDITDIKKAEEKIRESERRLTNLLEAVPVGISITNLEGKIIECNSNMFKIFGYDSKDEFLEILASDHYYNPTDRERFIELAERGIVKDFAVEFKRKDGSVFWGSLTSIAQKMGDQTTFITSLQDITDRKITEFKIQQSEAELSAIYNYTPIAIILVDNKAQIRKINRFALQFTGRQEEEVIGLRGGDALRCLNSIKDPKGCGFSEYCKECTIRNTVLDTFKTKTPHINVEATLDLLPGVEIDKAHFLISTVLLEFSGEELVLVSLIEITDRKKAEQKLKESEEKYRNLIKNINDLLIEVDLNRKITYASPQVRKILGYEPEEIIGLSTFDLIHPDEKLFEKDAILNALKSGEPLFTEHRVKHKNGNYVVLSMQGNVVKHDDEIKIVGVFRDITERKIAEEKLKESEEKFRTIAEQSALGVLIQQDGFIKFYNKAFSEIVEYPMEEINNWRVNDTLNLIHQDDLQIVKEKIRTREEGDFNKRITYEYRIVTKLGNIKWVEVMSKPVNYLGKYAVLISLIDTTARKKIEEELKEVSKLKSDLISRTSHELKTPLVSIKGYADLLLSQHYEELDFYTISVLHEIKQGCHRLESLIKDLLETSELETGEVELNKLKDDLAFLIRFCTKDLKGLIEMRKHSLILDIPENLVTLFEKERLYEVIINLLSNAIKYTPPNGRIIIKSKIRDNNYIISIKDNGIGLTEEEKERIFKKFGKIERYGRGMDVVSEGSGLGLYISKKIIELHGGHIWVESKGRDKGATFSFSLPILSE